MSLEDKHWWKEMDRLLDSHQAPPELREDIQIWMRHYMTEMKAEIVVDPRDLLLKPGAGREIGRMVNEGLNQALVKKLRDNTDVSCTAEGTNTKYSAEIGLVRNHPFRPDYPIRNLKIGVRATVIPSELPAASLPQLPEGSS